MSLREVAEVLVLVIEGAGMTVIVVGIVISALRAGRILLREGDLELAYRRLRLGLGHSLIIGIDLLIASEIILSIIAETLESVAVLGATVIVRVFLSFAIAVDVEGRVPWRRTQIDE